MCWLIGSVDGVAYLSVSVCVCGLIGSVDGAAYLFVSVCVGVD